MMTLSQIHDIVLLKNILELFIFNKDYMVLFNNCEPLRSIKIALIITNQEKATRGGPSIRIYETAKYLMNRHGLSVDIIDPSSNFDSYDILHFFNIWPYQESLNNLVSGYNSFKKIIFSPIYMPLDEFFLVSSKTIDIVNKARGRIEQIQENIKSIYTDDILTKIESSSYDPKGNIFLNKMLMLPDGIIYLSNKEKFLVSKYSVKNTKHFIIYNPVKKLWDKNKNRNFSNEFSIYNYVLCVGRIEPRKNQLLLAIAMKEAGLPLVLIGSCSDPFYLYLIHKFGPKELVIVDHLDHESGLLNTAYEGASVFCLPSWIEGAPLSALEAASFGCHLVLSNRASESEYFNDKAFYCDPADPIDIKNKVLEALNKKQDKMTISNYFRSKFSYENHVDNLINAYKEVL